MAGASTFCPCGSIVQLKAFSSTRASSVRHPDVALHVHRIPCAAACKTQQFQRLSLCGLSQVLQGSNETKKPMGVLLNGLGPRRISCSALADTPGMVVKETASAGECANKLL